MKMEKERTPLALISIKEVYSTVDEALSEIEREIAVRQRCFDRWVADGKLSYVDARDRLRRLISAWHFVDGYEACRVKYEVKTHDLPVPAPGENDGTRAVQ
jgi:hypothetical protein